MPGIVNHAAIIAWLLGISFVVKGTPVSAEQPTIEEVLSVLGMDKVQIGELAQGQPVIYALSEGRSDEIAAGIAWYLPVPLAKVAAQLRTDDPDLLDVDVTGHGILMTQSKADALSPVVLPNEEIEALLDAEPGGQFNLSNDEIERFKILKRTDDDISDEAIRDAVEQRYREMLFDRFKAYRLDGTYAIAPYARDNNRNVKPSVELDQAANASAILRYIPSLHKAWINYPTALPPKTNEVFQWVEKNVQSRPAFILRHHVNHDWNGGALILTREFYASHSYNASQWVTGCLPYRDGTVVFQQVRSYADQLSGVATDVRHLIGRKLLKNKMLKSFERLCEVLRHCH